MVRSICPFSTSAIASTTWLTGSEIDIAARIIARSPSTTATSANTIRASSIGAEASSNQPLDRMISRMAMANPGSAVHTVHIRSSRARTPGVGRPGEVGGHGQQRAAFGS